MFQTKYYNENALCSTCVRSVRSSYSQDRVVQGAVELESAPASDATAATVHLPPPPPSPVQNTRAPTQQGEQLAVLTLAARGAEWGAAPDSDATSDDPGDRQAELDAVMARNVQSSFEDRRARV